MYTGRDPLRPALMTDLYQLTMVAGYYLNRQEAEATFELFIRSLPPNRSYLMAVGLEQVAEFLLNMRFDEESVGFLRRRPCGPPGKIQREQGDLSGQEAGLALDR